MEIKRIKDLMPMAPTQTSWTGARLFEKISDQLGWDIFPSFSPARLFNLYWVKYGRKIVAPTVIEFNESIPDDPEAQETLVAEFIRLQFASSWERRLAVIMASYEPLNNYDMIETETISATDERTADLTNTDTRASETSSKKAGTDTHDETETSTRTPNLTKSTDISETLDRTETTSGELNRTEQTERSEDTNTNNTTVTTESAYGYNSPNPEPTKLTDVTENSTVTLGIEGNTGTNETNESTVTVTGSPTKSMTEAESGTDNTEGSRTGTTLYNTTVTETADETNTHKETGTDTTERESERTLTRKGNIGVTTSQQMIEAELKLREWNFFEHVFEDINTILTIPVY